MRVHKKRAATIPMAIKNGKIVYNKRVPHKYWRDRYSNDYVDVDSCKRLNALERPKIAKPISIARRNLYEFKHDLPPEYESTTERIKREYREWMEENL